MIESLSFGLSLLDVSDSFGAEASLIFLLRAIAVVETEISISVKKRKVSRKRIILIQTFRYWSQDTDMFKIYMKMSFESIQGMLSRNHSFSAFFSTLSKNFENIPTHKPVWERRT